MKFKPYSKTIDVTDLPPKGLIHALVNKDEWVVQEKVKGAQFSLWVGKGPVHGANRDRFLREGEPFFNWKAIRNTFTASLQDIRRRIGAHEIVIYGELFGGTYPHPDVAKYPEAIPLDRGVYYSPHNDWFAFDIVIDGMWQPQWYVYQLFDELGVRYAYELAQGKLDKVLKVPEQFESEVHQFWNFPRIRNNQCGGIVIRPCEPAFFGDGRRLLFKREVRTSGANQETRIRTSAS